MVRDAAGEQLTCFNVSGFQDYVVGSAGLFGEIEDPHALALKNVFDSAQATVVRTSTEQVLGIASTCYELISEASNATAAAMTKTSERRCRDRFDMVGNLRGRQFAER